MLIFGAWLLVSSRIYCSMKQENTISDLRYAIEILKHELAERWESGQ
jgi:hypothetical protein